MSRIANTIQFEPDVLEELNYLSTISQQSKSQVVNSLIRQEYNKFKEDPKLKKMLNDLTKLQAEMEKIALENSDLLGSRNNKKGARK